MATPKNDSASIGERIRQRRTELGLKQSDVASELNMTMQAVSLWETGKVSPGGGTLSTLAKVLKCDISWLLEGRTGEEVFTEALEEHDKRRKERGTNGAILSIHNKTLREFIPANKLNNLPFAEGLYNLVQLYCELDTSRRADILLHTIEQWKEYNAEEVAKLDNLYRSIKDGD